MEKKGLQFRNQVSAEMMNLPPLPSVTVPEIEMHMLCGKKQLDMGIVASWSLMRFIDNCILYVHSDGTIDDEDMIKWRHIIPGSVLIPKKEADEAVKNYLSLKYPKLYNWRVGNWAAYQLIDYSLFGKTSKIISCDSDVLCFCRPDFLLEKIKNDDSGIHWNNDLHTCYSTSLESLKRITGLDIPAKFNLGFIYSPRLTDNDFTQIEKMMEKLQHIEKFDLNHLWSSQTYFSFIVPFHHGSSPLPENYSIRKGKKRKNTVLRHYVGIKSIRPRYFLEGWKDILNQIQ